jgi:hypothetical protein
MLKSKQRMLKSNEYRTLAELSAAEQISRSYVCRVLRLTLLAPDIVERILDAPTAGLAQFLWPFRVEWEATRTVHSGQRVGAPDFTISPPPGSDHGCSTAR